MGDDKGGAKVAAEKPVDAAVAAEATKDATVSKTHELPVSKVTVHPLVLLSVVDHFNRMSKIGNQKRVVGLLLGSMQGKGQLDISNSFAGKYHRFLAVCLQLLIAVLFCARSAVR